MSVMKIISGALPAALGLLGVALVLSGCSKAKEGFDQGFKASFQKSFANSCTSGAVEKGAPEERVKPLCECLSKYMVDHYDALTLTKFSASPDSPEIQAALAEGMKSCEESARQ